MGNSLLQLIALAAVAVFLILKLRNTLGTRDGFEGPPSKTRTTGFEPTQEAQEVRVDRDITKFVEADSENGRALAQMKEVDNSFSVSDFIEGAGRAYEMILVAFVEGKLEEVRPFIIDEVYESFEDTVAERETNGVIQIARFVGLREVKISEAKLLNGTNAEVTVEFVGELISYAVDDDDNVIEGDDKAVRRQRDVWTFGRELGTSNPNWILMATDG
ncbi:MAG: Tim44/TimA family putative adaptor protein [Rhodobacteraceae bacterium]|nr:Tim44/TimA family putative adaptor protein [Paracoccaceae bacterium]MCY4195800.1 Tim44/TimA family putative adaptor protein [Paracoccaceae bacterium]MCY4327742.1 Tim44/TimA family putative adaptor protein [Paracoccaceae bacterium]